MKIVATPGVRKSVWLIAGALALVALAVLVLARVGAGSARSGAAGRSARTGASSRPRRPRATPRAAKPAASRHARRIARSGSGAAGARGSQRREQAALPPSHDDVPFSLGKPGEKSGMQLFPAHGTKPIKIGIVVPDDFEVPEGYVRHFQATENGELLPPILLFHPDYEWVDDAGNPIELPADRVVPPELAPPGLPIQMLEVRDEPGGAR